MKKCLSKQFLNETHRLFSFPTLHSRLVLFKLMAPVRVNLLIVVGLGRCRASVSIDSNVVGAKKSTSEPAVVPSRVLFIHTNDNQALLWSFDKLLSTWAVLVSYLIPSLFFAVMIPPNFLIRKNLGHLHETTQMDRLTPSHHQFSFTHTTVTNVRRTVWNVLQKTENPKLNNQNPCLKLKLIII